MAITIEIKDKTPELFQKLEAGIRRFVVKGSAYIQGELKSSMAEPKSGKRYGAHQASAPGESPAVDSSNLTGSIDILLAASMLEAKIGTPVGYALWLEDGTTRMDPRPLWERTATESLPTLENMLQAEIKGV
jgi:hypothetical protein